MTGRGGQNIVYLRVRLHTFRRMDFKDLLPVAISAARAACREILEVYTSGDFETERKEDNSPLTLADRRAHNVINDHLKQTFIPVLSEEGADIPFDERKHWERFWLVDPLDGTKEFLKRNGEFTVNIALVEHNQPVIGVVALPVTGEVYYAMTGEGAFLQNGDTLTPLPRRKPADIRQEGLRVVASRSHMNEDTRGFIDQLAHPTLVSAGSSLKFIAVAKGEADLYPRYIPCMEWDTAAADVIVQEVGLQTVDVVSRKPLLYNKESLLNPYFICGDTARL